MRSIIGNSTLFDFPNINIYEHTRGKTFSSSAIVYSIGRLLTDPIGLTTVTFTGVKANSEIRVYLADSTELAGIENCSADQVLSWDIFSAGSANNNVIIKIIHSFYKLKEFTYTSIIGTQSIPIQQEPDKWYNNP